MIKTNNKVSKQDLANMDIDKMLKDINDEKVIGGEVSEKDTKNSNEERTESQTAEVAVDNITTATDEKEKSEIWKEFIKNCDKNAYRVKKSNRRSYMIDDDIVNTLQHLNINKMAVSDIINAVMRSFITNEKDNLREFLQIRGLLI